MSISFVDEDLPSDLTPPMEFGAEYPCRVCGKEAGPYGGRGPKPKLCSDHKQGAPKAKSGSAVPRNSNSTLATQATDVLVQLNAGIGLGSMVLGYHQTASALSTAQEGFREQIYNALLLDPELCKMLLKGGQQSGKVALIIAYGMLGSAVVPVAVLEHKQKMADRKDALDEAGSEYPRAA